LAGRKALVSGSLSGKGLSIANKLPKGLFRFEEANIAISPKPAGDIFSFYGTITLVEAIKRFYQKKIQLIGLIAILIATSKLVTNKITAFLRLKSEPAAWLITIFFRVINFNICEYKSGVFILRKMKAMLWSATGANKVAYASSRHKSVLLNTIQVQPGLQPF
jgi:hypothetical protein